MDRIEAMKLLSEIKHYLTAGNPVWHKEVVAEALDIAIEALAADAVEVVRCKDCKRYESDGGALMTCTLTDLIVDDDCYCWWGERREQ